VEDKEEEDRGLWGLASAKLGFKLPWQKDS
jgi:hypothetical protein